MAAESTIENLWDEATCSICLDFFKDPVMIVDCGHNFCRACIAQCWEGLDRDITCPQCRQTFPQKSLRPNRQLASVVDIAKRLHVRKAEAAGGQQACGEHGEALKLFCQDDEIPICVVCGRSRAHRSHSVVPLEEATEAYKEKLQAHLKTLRERRENLLGLKQTGEGKIQKSLKQAGAKRQKIVSDFQQLRRLLQEQEQLLLAQLGELEKEVAKMQKEKDTKLSEEISHLSELISEMEAKCQQPASEFLQDIRRTLSRCEKRVIPQPVPTSSELERRLQDFCQQTCALTETVRKFKDTLLSACEQENEDLLGSYTKAAVTLAPGTAHPRLVLSADRRSVRWRQAWQPLLNNPERFNFMYCVLGHEGFTSGKHCWEVEVGEGDCWAVGAATESVRRKGKFFFSPDEGIWAVQHQFSGPLEALTAPDPTPLSQCQVPRRVRVCLDYAAGQVSFFNADTKAPVFTFPPALFAGERIRPWLWLKPFNVASFGTPALKLCP